MDKPKPQGNIFDAFAKQEFSKVAVFADFLLHYADPKFVAEIDLKKIKPAPTHYIGKEGDERIVDLVFQCPLKSGSGTLMTVIVFEHQSGNLKKIPWKLHKYISAIWDAEMKEGRKILSAPYFIVLRTGKKPMRTKPTMSDWLPQGANGKPIGKTVEIDYDVVDLPAKEFGQLIGIPELRLALGILHKMTGGKDDEFPEALMPLREIADHDQKIELTRDLLNLVAKTFLAHNKKLDSPVISETLDAIFKEEEKVMRLTFIEEIEARGEARGEAKGEAKGEARAGRNMLLSVLRTKFGKVPKDTEKTILKMSDPVALESWTIQAAMCSSLKEFVEAMK